jgi:hypothetical protein
MPSTIGPTNNGGLAVKSDNTFLYYRFRPTLKLLFQPV